MSGGLETNESSWLECGRIEVTNVISNKRGG